MSVKLMATMDHLRVLFIFSLLTKATASACSANCKYCTGSAHCTECETSFYKSDSISGVYCSPCSNNCAICTVPTACITCKPGYNIGYDEGGNKYCYSTSCPNHCTRCSSTTQCTACETGYRGNTCTECSVGYYKSGSNCYTCPTHCTSCSNNNWCTGCANGYRGNTCTECTAGYYKSGSNCYTCPTHCTGCSNNNWCTGCANGYRGNTCTECTAGYYKSGSNCYTCPTHCTGCSNNNWCTGCANGYRGNTCTECTAGYYKSGSNCYKCPTHCTGCSNNNWCTGCANGYRGNTCTECTAGYYKSGSNCYTCPTHCTGCSNNNWCTGCANGYRGNTCTECTAGYYKSGSNCYTCPTHCTGCSNNNWCTGCANGYRGNTCTECTAGYYKSGSNCYKCPTHCTGCSDSSWCTGCATGYRGNTCNQCISGYFKSGNNCYPCRSHCVSCTGYTACTVCTTGYQGTTCNQCTAGYFMYGVNCYKCPTRCTTCSSYTQCTACDNGYQGTTCNQCVEGYYQNGNSCKKCPTPCTSCSSNTQCTACKDGHIGATCDQCSAGYFRDGNNQCQSCSSSCKTCSDYFWCDSCKAGKTGPKCDSSCTGTCPDGTCDIATGKCDINCQEGSYLELTLKCSPCSSPCQNCVGANTNCTKCLSKYYLASNECKECPPNCTSCNENEPNDCLTCQKEYYGRSCEHTCSNTCIKTNTTLNGICFKDNGTCSHGCVKGSWGPQCDSSCSSGCADPLQCSPTDGSCEKCITGRSGDRCEETCSSNCNNPNNGSNMCSRSDGACLFGCIVGMSGTTCETDAGVTEKHVSGNGNIPAIAGGGAGGLVAVVVVLVVVICVVRRKRRNKRGLSNTEEETPVTLSDSEYVNCQVKYKPDDIQREESAFIDANRPIFIGGSQTRPVSNGDSKKIAVPNGNSKKKSVPNTDSKKVRLSNVLNQASTTDDEEVEIELDDDENNLLPVPEPDQTPDTYYNMAGLIRSRIAVDKLQDYVNNRTKDDFDEEFEKLPTGLTRSYNAAMQNKANNRYAKIYPYDVSRVVLKTGPSDYINASYIDSYSQYNTYIANLGPTDKVMPGYISFWRMVWQEKVEVIVMLTNLMEGGTMKCEQYWPEPGINKTYSDVTVTCHSEDVYAEYTVRSFTVQMKTEKRTLHHIHYTAWPDKGVPDDVTSLIEFRQRVISCPMKLGGPTIVHCSAGIGRTGTYMALDILTREGRAEKTVDVFGCVTAMRGQRVNMVQTAEQYEYLHHALVHSLTFDCDPIQSHKVQAILRSSNTSILQAQYEHLSHTADVISDEEKKTVAENKALTEKNRPGADIPGKRHRPWLNLLRKPGASNYINAVFVNSFKQKDRYIVAQTPLPTTVVDFLSLVVQTNCSCILSLDDASQHNKTVGVYLPAQNEVAKHGVFRVKCNSCETTPQYIRRQLEISTNGPNSPEPRHVDHFQCTLWGHGDTVPKDPAAFLQLTRDVERMSQEAVDSEPMIVHCLTGASRSALFCVVSILIQKMEIEHQVSVVNTVRQVKARRRTAIPDKEQYLFCHQCLAAYIQSFETYSNFSL